MTTTVMTPTSNGVGEADRLAEINSKLDRLTTAVSLLGDQLNVMSEKVALDQQRQQVWDDLKTDMTPIVRDMYQVTVEQLEEIQEHVQLEELLHLLKRLARHTGTFNAMLEQLESAQDLWADLSPLTSEMVAEMVAQFGELEQRGYFAFLRQSQYVLDQIVTSFSEEDVRLLGDNVVLILNTVKSLTQPEMMNLIGGLTQGFQEVEDHADELPTSLLGLAGQLRDPDVRRGLAITLAMLKRISKQH